MEKVMEKCKKMLKMMSTMISIIDSFETTHKRGITKVIREDNDGEE